MNEAEWIDCKDPHLMFDVVRGKVSDRKLRLLACALCETYRNSFPDRSSTSIEMAYRVADGLASESERARVFAEASAVEEAEDWRWRHSRLALPVYAAGTRSELDAIPRFVSEEFAFDIYSPARATVCARFRELFGSLPVRTMSFDPEWRTTTAVQIAQGIYTELAFDRMPILADALQDADCDNDDILAHLRDATAPHVRGCWALDLVLGKE